MHSCFGMEHNWVAENGEVSMIMALVSEMITCRRIRLPLNDAANNSKPLYRILSVLKLLNLQTLIRPELWA